MLLCTFLLSSNTVCILIFWDVYVFREYPGSEDFRNNVFTRSTLSKDFLTGVGYHCSNHTAAREVLQVLLSDLSRYCQFGETLLTPSRVVDMSTIYLHRYAVGALVAVTCTNKSGRFQ